MFGAQRGFFNIDGILELAKKPVEAADEKGPEKVDDLFAGISAAYGRGAAVEAVEKIVATFPDPPADRSLAIDYLSPLLEPLVKQYGKEEILASLSKHLPTPKPENNS